MERPGLCYVAQHRENCRVAQDANFLTSSGTVSFSRKTLPLGVTGLWVGHSARKNTLEMRTKLLIQTCDKTTKASRTWQDNIKIDVKEVGWEGTLRIHQAQAVVNAVMSLLVP